MAEESFKLSYIVSFLADYLDDDAGFSNHGPNYYIDTTPLLQNSNHGPNYYINTGDLLSNDNHGPNYWITTPGDLLLNDSHGPNYYISSSGIIQGVIFGDLIHYGEQAAFKGDVLLSDGVMVRAANTGSVWQQEGQSVVVNNCVANTVLDEFDSGSVNINTGVSGTTELTLPPASTRRGLSYTFVRTSTSGAIHVIPTGVDAIFAPSGLATSSGISLDTFGAKLKLISDGGVCWDSEIEFGALRQIEPPFTPASLSNLVLWLDASDASTITQDINGVSQWADKSLAGVISGVAQFVNANKPTVDSGSVNGLDALLFDDTAPHYLSGAQVFDAAPFTIFVVAESNDAALRQCAFGVGSDGDGNTSWLMRWEGTLGGDPLGFAINQSVVVFTTANTSTGYSANQAHLLTYIETADDDHRVKIDGGSDGTSVVAVAPVGSNVTTVGIRPILGQPFSGRICEIVVVSGVASMADEINMENYVGRWGTP